MDLDRESRIRELRQAGERMNFFQNKKGCIYVAKVGHNLVLPIEAERLRLRFRWSFIRAIADDRHLDSRCGQARPPSGRSAPFSSKNHCCKRSRIIIRSFSFAT